MIILRYNPNRTGLARWLGAELSAPLMDWLWEQSPRDFTARYVYKYFPRRLGYTTVKTTMDRLVKYGLLSVRMHRHTCYFTPRYSREQWEAAQIAAIVASFEETVVSDEAWGHGGWE